MPLFRYFDIFRGFGPCETFGSSQTWLAVVLEVLAEGGWPQTGLKDNPPIGRQKCAPFLMLERWRIRSDKRYESCAWEDSALLDSSFVFWK